MVQGALPISKENYSLQEEVSSLSCQKSFSCFLSNLSFQFQFLDVFSIAVKKDL